MYIRTTVFVVVASLTCPVQSTNADEAGFVWQDLWDDRIELLWNEKPALFHIMPQLDESSPENRISTCKPYYQVFGPDCSARLTKGLGGKRPCLAGISYGFSNVTYADGKTCDIWHCTDNAHQEGIGLGWMIGLEVEADADKIEKNDNPCDVVSHCVHIDWHGRNGDRFARERRILGVSRDVHYGVEGWEIDFISLLETTDGKPIHLEGDPHSAGLYFCATEEVAEKTVHLTYYLRPDGKGKPGEYRSWDPENPTSPESISCENRLWTALCFVLRDEHYTVLHMGHPINPKPSYFSEDALGCFGSSFFADVTKEEPLGVICRWWIQKGVMTIEQCAEIQRNYVPDFNKQIREDYLGMVRLSP